MEIIYKLESIVCNMCDRDRYGCFNCDVKLDIKEALKTMTVSDLSKLLTEDKSNED